MRARVLIQALIIGAALGVAAAAPAQAQHGRGAPKQWWCEAYAQPASGSGLTQEEAKNGFFFSQIIERPRPRRDEAEQLERRCRTSFEVQFGGQWTLVTARAYSAGTADAATSARLADMNDPTRRGHTRVFHMAQ